MKKFVIAIGALILIGLAAIVIIPMVYDVNTRVRPQIISAIEENTNAKVEIGNLGLSLWGGIYITVESMKLIDPTDMGVVFEMSNAKLNVPVRALLGGTLEITVMADRPKFNLIKDKHGKLNALRLVKPGAAKSADTPDPSGPKGGSPAVGIAERFTLSTRIRNASLKYVDQMSGSQSTIDQLGLRIDDVGINRPIKMKVTANLAITQGKDLSLNGPMSFEGTTKVVLKPEGLEKVDFEALLDLDALAIRYATLFNKESKVPLNVETRLTFAPDALNVEKLDLIANNFKINTVIRVQNFEAPILNIQVKSTDFKFASWKNIIAPIRDFDMDGSANLNFHAQGTAEKHTYDGEVKLKDASLRAPGLVPRIENMNAELAFENESLKVHQLSMKMGSSDLSATGSVSNFKAPVVIVNVESKLLNVDELIGLKPDEKPATPTPTVQEVSQEEKDRQMESMAKGPIQAIKSNPVARALVFNANAKIKKMIAHKMPMSDFAANVGFEKLVMSLKEAKLKAFGGTADAKLAIDFNGADPAYKASGNIKGVDIDEAMTSQFEDMKGFITGKAQATFELAGSGVTVGKAKQTLTGAGKFDVINGTWSGLTPLKMIAEKLKDVPQAKDKLGGVAVGNKFKSLTGGFDIKSGRINLSNVTMDLEEARTGAQLVGWIDFDKKLGLSGVLLAPIADAPKKLLGSDGRARIPFEVNGTIKNPQPNYDATLKPIAAAYLEHEGKKALDQAVKKGADELKKNIKDEKVKDLLKGIGL